jgi:hypothetical protein
MCGLTCELEGVGLMHTMQPCLLTWQVKGKASPAVAVGGPLTDTTSCPSPTRTSGSSMAVVTSAAGSGPGGTTTGIWSL